jgi:integrase
MESPHLDDTVSEGPAAESVECPQCSSKRLYKDGLRYDGGGRAIQRWLCRECGLRFSLNSEKRPLQENSYWHINTAGHSTSGRQVCDLAEESKNLIATESKTVAGEGKTQQGAILDYAWKLKKRGLADVTISTRTYLLERMVKKGVNLSNPDSVETFLATEELTSAKKCQLVSAYRSYTSTMNISWIPIKVKYQPKQPFIPMESELDQLIAGCGKKTATFLQVLKDTGARSSEACKLKWTDVNQANNTISINNPEKGSNSRTIRVSDKTIAMINAMPKKYGEYIFNPRLLSIEDAFRVARKRLVRTLQNPRLKQIHFHTFRHWKATMEYARTKDILYVMKVLGHKNIQNTLIYTQLINFESDQFHSATARTIEEAQKLVESGFSFVCDVEGFKLFRKPK